MHAPKEPVVLSYFPSSEKGWLFDLAGRNFGAWEDGWWISHGLSGRSVARRWRNGRRDVRELAADEIARHKAKARAEIQKAGDIFGRADIRRTAAFDDEADRAAYRRVFRPVGILPPDQYESVVVQVTEGCAWNQCRFCSFYKAQKYRLRTKAEIEKHAEAIQRYLGRGLSRRTSIFLGEANALAMPPRMLAEIMAPLDRILVAGMPGFRGYFSFIEPSDSRARSVSDFKLLQARGLRRLCWGVETGDPSLRTMLGKPGFLAEAEQTLRNAKSAGILAAAIFLIGAGGEESRDSHRRLSLSWLKKQPLDARDIVYLSPLRGEDGLGGPPLSEAQLEAEVARWKAEARTPARLVPYDIREFVY